jgi:hypothetical protein
MDPEGKDPGGDELARYFDEMNEPMLSDLETVLEMDEHQDDVITFSHYLPRQELLPVLPPPHPTTLLGLIARKAPVQVVVDAGSRGSFHRRNACCSTRACPRQREVLTWRSG